MEVGSGFGPCSAGLSLLKSEEIEQEEADAYWSVVCTIACHMAFMLSVGNAYRQYARV